jgi:hypothetical protein
MTFKNIGRSIKKIGRSRFDKNKECVSKFEALEDFFEIS